MVLGKAPKMGGKKRNDDDPSYQPRRQKGGKKKDAANEGNYEFSEWKTRSILRRSY